MLVELKYSIAECSGHALDYAPQNVLIDDPSDQSSRWCSDPNLPLHFLTLKLDNVALLRQIRFGKYVRCHVCNLKSFTVYGGPSLSQMTHILEAGLANDSMPEVFDVSPEMLGSTLPIKYLEIRPIQSWGPTFNFSIWSIKLFGIEDVEIIEDAEKHFRSRVETSILKMCLSFFRETNDMETFKFLQDKYHICLENPSLSKIHECLQNVTENMSEIENLLEASAENGLFDDFLASAATHGVVKEVVCSNPCPKPRGGHQMVCLDDLVYLFGGFDGTSDLNDLWILDPNKKTWLEQSTPLPPRSMHRMCVDTVRKQIFILGKYESVKTAHNDFHMFDATTRQWTLISGDVSEDGGPEVLYNHEMVFDPLKRQLFVFGGRTVSNSLSPLFKYDVACNAWTRVVFDEGVLPLRSNFGAVLCDRRIHFVGGFSTQAVCLRDVVTFDVDSEQVEVVCSKALPDEYSALKVVSGGTDSLIFIVTHKTPHMQVFRFDVSQRSVHPVSTEFPARSAFAVCRVDDAVIGCGGKSPAGDRLSDVWSLRPQRLSRGHVVDKCRDEVHTLAFKTHVTRADFHSALAILQLSRVPETLTPLLFSDTPPKPDVRACFEAIAKYFTTKHHRRSDRLQDCLFDKSLAI